jgi:hypothetical protein
MGPSQSPPRTAAIYFDGDDVGARIELCLLREDVDGAAHVSAAVTSAIQALAHELRMTFDATVKFAAGDEVFAIMPTLPSLGEVDILRNAFADRTGITISCGIGFSSQEAAKNLHYAKLLGKDMAQIPSRA